jgi:hypothetical protein
MDFLKVRGNPKIYYWHAEKSFWDRSCNQQLSRTTISSFDKAKIRNWNMDDNLKDLRKLFVDSQIVVKDCFSFGLKNIACAMKKHKLINTPIESECIDGLTAMVKAWKTYKTINNPTDAPVMKDIIKYNEFDCKVLYDILEYLRKNH